MAKLPTAETLGRNIINILVADGARPGHGTTIQAVRARFGNERPGEDLKAGLLYAEGQEWIEFSRGGSFVKITAKGFEAADDD